jgi:hypothetical protein
MNYCRKAPTKIYKNNIKSFITAHGGQPWIMTTNLIIGDKTTWPEVGMHHRVEKEGPPQKEVEVAQVKNVHLHSEWPPSRLKITVAEHCHCV